MARSHGQNARQRTSIYHRSTPTRREVQWHASYTLSTIHGSKGGEAENVVLFTDISPAASKAAESDPDELHRVFYVGVTRTKKLIFNRARRRIEELHNMNRKKY